MSKRSPSSLHFIFTNPSNESRSDVIREIRAHAAKWTWQQGRQYRNQRKPDTVDDGGRETPGVGNSSQAAEEVLYNEEDAEPFPPFVGPSLVSGAGMSVVSSTSVTAQRPRPSNAEPSAASRFGLELSLWERNFPENADQAPAQPALYQSTSMAVNNLSACILDPFQTHVPSPLPSGVISMSDKYSLSVVWPGLMPRSAIGESHAGVHAWFLISQSHPALHSSMLFGSYSHRRARVSAKGYGRFDGKDAQQMAHAEADSISKINRIIHDPSQAVSDAVILSVLCLANNETPAWKERKESPFQAPLRSLQWLDVYGRLSPNPTHQAGLAQLIYLKGGLDKIELPGLAAIISLYVFDKNSRIAVCSATSLGSPANSSRASSSILAASRTISRPHFSLIPVQDGPPPTLHDTTDTYHPIVDIGPGPRLSLQITSEMRDILRAAQAYVCFVEAYIEGSPTSLNKITICDHRNLIQWHIMSLPPVSQLGPIIRQFYPVYESCRLALVIFGVGVIFPLPAETAPLNKLVRMLQLELHSVEYSVAISSSMEALHLHFWCVVLGGISATGSQERAWFVHELRRVAVLDAVSNWGELRAILRSILWFDSACNLAGKELWMEAMSLASGF